MYEVVTKYIRITSNGKTNEIIATEDVSREIERLREENKRLKQELSDKKEKKQDSGFLNTNEAAEYLKVTPQHVRNLVNDKKLVFMRDFVKTSSGRLMFKKKALDSWIEGRTNTRLAVV
ncbi:MAG: helix-turn-helix domain-containing protein [Deferribacterales bacterium]